MIDHVISQFEGRSNCSGGYDEKDFSAKNDVSSSSTVAELSNLHKSVQQLLNEKCAELATPWKAEIKFPVYPVHDKRDDLSVVFSKPPEEHDICSFLNEELDWGQ